MTTRTKKARAPGVGSLGRSESVAEHVQRIQAERRAAALAEHAKAAPSIADDPTEPSSDNLRLRLAMAEALAPWQGNIEDYRLAAEACAIVCRAERQRYEAPLRKALHQAYEDRNRSAARCIEVGKQRDQYVRLLGEVQEQRDALLDELATLRGAHRPAWRRWLAWAGF